MAEKIRQWTKDILDKINDAKKQKAWKMWLSCHTEDEIAESLKVSQDTINKWIKQKKQEIGKSVIFPESLQIYNICSGITRVEDIASYYNLDHTVCIPYLFAFQIHQVF